MQTGRQNARVPRRQKSEHAKNSAQAVRAAVENQLNEQAQEHAEQNAYLESVLGDCDYLDPDPDDDWGDVEDEYSGFDPLD